MIIVNNKMKKALESPVIWPVAGCIILYILICIVSGSVNARVITSGLKLCVFAMLLGVAQMIVEWKRRDRYFPEIYFDIGSVCFL